MEVVFGLKCKLTNCQFLTLSVLEISLFFRVAYLPVTVPLPGSGVQHSTVHCGNWTGGGNIRKKVFTDLDETDVSLTVQAAKVLLPGAGNHGQEG